jgi:hypothetical protein
VERPKIKYRHIEATLFIIDVLNHTVEVVKGAIDHSHHLAGLKYRLGLGLIDACLNPLQDDIGLSIRNR